MYKRITYGKYNGPYNYSEFVCDTVDDVANLPTAVAHGASGNDDYHPCSVGSTAFVLEDSTTYVLNNNNEWVSASFGGSGLGRSGAVGVVNQLSEITDTMQIVLLDQIVTPNDYIVHGADDGIVISDGYASIAYPNGDEEVY